MKLIYICIIKCMDYNIVFFMICGIVGSGLFLIPYDLQFLGINSFIGICSLRDEGDALKETENLECVVYALYSRICVFRSFCLILASCKVFFRI